MNFLFHKSNETGEGKSKRRTSYQKDILRNRLKCNRTQTIKTLALARKSQVSGAPAVTMITYQPIVTSDSLDCYPARVNNTRTLKKRYRNS